MLSGSRNQDVFFLDLKETLSGDQQEALMTLIRSYLAGLANPLLAPPPCVEDFVLPCGPGERLGIPESAILDEGEGARGGVSVFVNFFINLDQ